MDMRRCKGIDEVSVMEVSKSHGCVRRSRDAEVTSSASCKRRRFDPREQENVVEMENQCRSGVDVNFPANVVSSAEFGSSNRVLSSVRSRNYLNLDLKVELGVETEISMSSNDGFSRETSPSTEICSDSEDMEPSSTLKKKPAAPQSASSRCKTLTAANIPTAREIEEFFSAAEKKEQKRFADKYNYDIVNDVPMEGRFQWVRLKP